MCCDRSLVFFFFFYPRLHGNLLLNSFKRASSIQRMYVNVCARRQWEEASLCADKLPMEYSESTVAPEASRGPRGRDSGRERRRGGEQCDRRWRGGEAGRGRGRTARGAA